HPIRLRIRISHEIPRRKPQLVGAPVDLLGEVADVLQPLQFGKGRIDMADGDDARHAGRGDDRQNQQKAAKGQLADRDRKRPPLSRTSGKSHRIRCRVQISPGYTPESTSGGTGPATAGRPATAENRPFVEGSGVVNTE